MTNGKATGRRAHSEYHMRQTKRYADGEHDSDDDPIIVSRRPSRATSCSTFLLVAPNAMRTPISRVRLVTP